MCAESLELVFPPTSTSGTWTWPSVNNLDGRRLEVVADSLTLWHGAQLARDTTLVSPLRRDGSARPKAADHDGAALDDAHRRMERTYPELSGDGGRACLAAKVGGRWKVETANFLASLAGAKALDSAEQRSSGQFSDARVLCFVAGPLSSAGSRGHPFSECEGARCQVCLSERGSVTKKQQPHLTQPTTTTTTHPTTAPPDQTTTPKKNTHTLTTRNTPLDPRKTRTLTKNTPDKM